MSLKTHVDQWSGRNYVVHFRLTTYIYEISITAMSNHIIHNLYILFQSLFIFFRRGFSVKNELVKIIANHYFI